MIEVPSGVLLLSLLSLLCISLYPLLGHNDRPVSHSHSLTSTEDAQSLEQGRVGDFNGLCRAHPEDYGNPAEEKVGGWMGVSIRKVWPTLSR